MDGIRLTLSLLLVLSLAACSGSGLPPAVHQLSPMTAERLLVDDAVSVQRYRERALGLVEYLEGREDLLHPGGQATLTRSQKRTALTSWASLQDLMHALESIRQYHARYWRIDDDEHRRRSFLIMYGAFLAQYATALRLLSWVEKSPELAVVLDDAAPELQHEAGQLALFRGRFLNLGMAARFAAFETVRSHYPNRDWLGLAPALEADVAALWKAGRGAGTRMTLANATEIARQTAFETVFPVQAGVSEWMGDTKVKHRPSLVTPEQIAELAPLLLPGDILLERREWYLSNIGLPGFWPHAALYVGTPQERTAFFAAAPELASWVVAQGEPSGDFERLLAKNHTPAYAAHLAPGEGGHQHRLIEAISEGVSHTTLEHSADCDSLVVLRPRLGFLEKARAIGLAFLYAGRPYDFNFDFTTDSEMVCTELVAKVYEAAEGHRGLRFPLTTLAGRKVLPANLIARQFDREFDQPAQQLDFVTFLDGDEHGGKAAVAGLDEFRQSWKRPKWHILVKRNDE